MVTSRPSSTTAEKLIAAMIECIGEVGWAQASTNLIAERAGVNQLTLFRHFGTKKQLLEATLEAVLARLAANDGPLVTEDLRSRLISVAHMYMRDVGPMPAFMLRIMAEAQNPETAAIIEPYQTAILERLRAIFKKYSHDLQQPMATDELVLLFMGPIYLRIALSHTTISVDSTAETYVEAFLKAYGNQL